MLIAVASGKGGTGKTTVAIGLALAYRALGRDVQLVDCDVEEPNVHLFLRPEITDRVPATVPVPVIHAEPCDLCGRCARVCEFGALTCLRDEVLLLPELCHACGACVEVCPRDAISETPREVGTIEFGGAAGIAYGGGRLNVGEARSTPVIEQLKRHAQHDAACIIDAPPGTSCPTMAAIRDVDYVCLVAEPTPFGRHDLALAAAAVEEFNLPAGLVVNRAGMGDETAAQVAERQGLPLLAEIPDDRRVAAAQSRGALATEAVPQLLQVFETLAARLEEQVSICRS